MVYNPSESERDVRENGGKTVKWKKGQSGNPATQFKPGNPGGGRPRKGAFTEQIERLAPTQYPMDSITPVMLKAMGLRQGQKCTFAEMAVRFLFLAMRTGKSGTVNAFREMCDRVEGKAIQPVEMSGPGGDPITLLERIERAEARLRAKADSEKASLRGRASG